MGACFGSASSSTGNKEEMVRKEAEKKESEWAKYDGKELEEPIERGWVGVLDSLYLVGLADRREAVRRRQDMPDNAYLSLAQLKLLGVREKNVGGASVYDKQTWLPLVILSYPWLTPSHPDPHGETLATLAKALKRLRDRHGVIVDFTALPQVPRDTSEETTFRSGLKALNLFYTHPYVVVFKVTEFPSDYPGAEKYRLGRDFTPVQYADRGWCYAESCMANLGGKPKLVCDLSHLSDKVIGSGASGTPPPLTPEAFNQVLSTKTFTQAKTDTERVKNLYLSSFNIRIQNAKSLRFADLGWGAAEVHDLAKVLESKRTLVEHLDLGHNELGVEGSKAVAQVVNTHDPQKRLFLSLRKCCLGDGGAVEIAEALKVNTCLTQLSLGDNEIGDAGAGAVAEALKVNTSLNKLYLKDNRISDEGARALGEALKSNTSRTTLELLHNQIGDEGARALGEALKINSSLAQLDLEMNAIGDEGAKALGKALKVNVTLTMLWLAENNIGDEGARALGEAKAARLGCDLQW